MTAVNVNVHVDDSTDVVGKVVEHGPCAFAVLKVGPVDIFTAAAGRDAILKFTADMQRALDTIRAQVAEAEAEAMAEAHADNDMPPGDVR